jgi:mono/diheme cytochrome c family protein
MDRMHVRTTSIAIAALILLSAVLFGWATRAPSPIRPPEAEAADGAALFDRYCASCHTLDDLRARQPAGVEIARRRNDMVQFLSSHGDASEEDDRTIAAYVIR